MGIRPPDADMIVAHTYWDSPEGLICPLCSKKIEYAYNDGGRTVVTLKGNIWVVSNYYRCLNKECSLNKAFRIEHENAVPNKKYGRDVWEKVVRFHFRHHLDYSQIKGIIFEDWSMSISKSTIQRICNYFEKSSTVYLDETVAKEVKKSREIVLSLDGAQPKKGRPALWIFSDRITGHVLLTELLNSAAAPILVNKMREIEEKFGVPIKAVISDKQKNIVNAVRDFNKDIPHVYCQYHFLDHIMDPISVKDTNLAKTLKKAVRKFSIVVHQPQGTLDPSDDNYNALYDILTPLTEELLNAISVPSKKWSVFKGKEIYENLFYILKNLEKILIRTRKSKVQRSIQAVLKNLKILLKENKELYNEIRKLLKDANDLRDILDNSNNRPEYIKKQVKTWVYRLQSRLKTQDMEYHASELKHTSTTDTTSLPVIWQEWIRLEASYHSGLYHSYKNEKLEKTNNAKEQLINQTKRHFKKWLGQQDIQDTFERHSEAFSRLIPLTLNNEEIHEILWKHSIAYVEGYTNALSAFEPVKKRDWRIREKNTGNFQLLKKILKNPVVTKL
jgi:hypothetical protein